MPEQSPAHSHRLTARAWRGKILHAASAEDIVFLNDGGLLVDADGRIAACAAWQELASGNRLSGFDVTELPPHMLIIPGFVDAHVHLPQMAVTGCREENLLSWLERHIFAEEARFADAAYAARISHWFFSELLRNGTTTATVFLTSHDEATRIAFETADTLGNRVVMGQNLMDVNAPDALLRPADRLLAETEAHCRRWHGADKGRIQYAWVPRFAITSSEDLLIGIGRLRQQHPDVYLHTHLSEQLPEIHAVQMQFPWAQDYTAVYEKFGLLGHRTILAHGIYLSDGELDRLKHLDASLAHCPSSNFFLKSGRFRWLDVLARQIRLGLGSDVGAGPELSLFRVMKDAQYMQDEQPIPLGQLFYAATLGGARALWLDDRVGNFIPGKEADFLLIDCRAKPGFAQPEAADCASGQEMLLSRLIHLGDDRLVAATFIRGQRRYGHSPESRGALTSAPA